LPWLVKIRLINSIKYTALENKILSFKHSCFSGDLIYALASIKALCEIEGDKAVIYQWLNKEGFLYQGAEHPYGGKMMNDYAFEMMKPLIESQPYVKEFKPWNGEKVHVNLDVIRQVKNHMPYGNIVTWIAMVYAEATPRYWEPWINIPQEEKEDIIIINRTSRYHNQWIDYFFLKEYQDKILFIGLEEEFKQFQMDWGLDVKWYTPGNAYQIAVLLQSCKLFIGNQSMCFAIAEAMKVPRILEVCDMAPNVIPAGEGGYYARNPDTFKFIVEKLLK
jgi:hypothetical protein